MKVKLKYRRERITSSLKQMNSDIYWSFMKRSDESSDLLLACLLLSI